GIDLQRMRETALGRGEQTGTNRRTLAAIGRMLEQRNLRLLAQALELSRTHLAASVIDQHDRQAVLAHSRDDGGHGPLVVVHRNDGTGVEERLHCRVAAADGLYL